MLTDHQLQHFRTFGFVTLRKLFTPEEVEILRQEYVELPTVLSLIHI